jgi:hypothetical protein
MYQSNVPSPDDRHSASKHVPSELNLNKLDRAGQRQPVVKFPQQNSVPAWLQSLLKVQRGAQILFGGIFGLSLIVYGYTVYTQDLWKQQHGQLTRLQNQERQQGVMNENLKHKLAIDAEQPLNGLENPDPQKIIFITGAPQRPAKSPSAILSSSQPAPASQQPMGY